MQEKIFLQFSSILQLSMVSTHKKIDNKIDTF